MTRVEIQNRSLSDYLEIVSSEVIEEIEELGRLLRGARVLHVNATAYGGGVAEMLHPLVGLMNGIGLAAEWQVIEGSDEFFNMTKASHNGLQGTEIRLTQRMERVWREYNRRNAESMSDTFDYVVAHDPQPAGLLHFADRSASRFWLWRCHIDASTPCERILNFYFFFIDTYTCEIYTLPEFVSEGLHFERLAAITPKIDPLSPKNLAIPRDTARREIARFGLDPARPFVTQVSRYDRLKDPCGVIDAYRIAKREFPDLQVALIGSMASDDPEGWTCLDAAEQWAAGDKDIHILHNLCGVGPYEVGCFQTASNVVVQKSLKEGFGLVVTEALWKETPVVASNVGGIPLQVIDGETGFLIDSIDDCAEKLVSLLCDPEPGERTAIAGREHVRRNFLIPQHLRDYLRLFADLASA